MAIDPVVGLGAAIQALREQLVQARSAGWYEELGFQVEPIELTIQAVVDRDVNGKIGWGVLSVGGDYKSSTTQTLKLTLTPVKRNSDGSVTRDFTVSDRQSEEPIFGKKPIAGSG
jgi:hypothetical protein